jgi:hypothetical protein
VSATAASVAETTGASGRAPCALVVFRGASRAAVTKKLVSSKIITRRRVAMWYLQHQTERAPVRRELA